jgi:hypothetical protein
MSVFFYACSGEVPNMFPYEERTSIIEAVRQIVGIVGLS